MIVIESSRKIDIPRQRIFQTLCSNALIAAEKNCCGNLFNQYNVCVLTPLVGGGTIYSNGFFFVQSILADRYIRRREM